MPSWITSKWLWPVIKRLVLYPFTGLALTTAIVLAYLFGAAHGFEAGQLQGYEWGRAEGLARLEEARSDAEMAGYLLGAQDFNRKFFYLGVYSTCLLVMRDLYEMPSDTSIVYCERGLAWAYRERLFENRLTDEFWWPVRNLEEKQIQGEQ